ncbi:hypothetical protein FN976_02440 [Caenimonas sedimenti]|uniref:HEAT repeat domain-containing protein n=1 Tax=Caenimonas sedimenti TaxID=2596921 RepID=A0A562ZXK0_9BURK|nr:hypothetical protein [Caenimonas sedimenti]TWO73116.1 hypothetical protein FN976_02440 [Caenimonas sedimenti]
MNTVSRALVLLAAMTIPLAAMGVCLEPANDLAARRVSSGNPKEVAAGLDQLLSGASGGDDRARLCLAFMHLQRAVPSPSNDAALALLQQVSTSPVTKAILTAAIYAEGTPSFPADRARASLVFEDIGRQIRSAMESMIDHATPPKNELPKNEPMEALFLDFILHRHFAKKHGFGSE